MRLRLRQPTLDKGSRGKRLSLYIITSRREFTLFKSFMKQLVVGEVVIFDDAEYTVTQITMRAKDGSKKVVLQEVKEAPVVATTEHGVPLGI